MQRANSESGFALIAVIALSSLLLAVAGAALELTRAETVRSYQAVKKDASYQAAEAGIGDYTAKLLEDNNYDLHYVALGEATRQAPSGTQVGPNTAWTGDTTWTYPNGRNNWRQLTNGYEYSLRITAPSPSVNGVTILSTGRPVNDTNTGDWRQIETVVRTSAASDFQMIADADISYGSGATTNGRVYAGIDSGGVAHSVTHNGTASANVYAEGHVYGPPTLTNGARTYDSTTIRSVISTPLNFNDFQISLVNVANVAQTQGIYLNDTTKAAWKLTFTSTGSVQVQSCTGSNINTTQPTCGAITNYTVPASGAIYSGQSVIVSGQVKGRVTVASNNDVLIGNATSYVQQGTDVLGLIAASDIVIPQWAPTDLTWWAAAIAESGQFMSASNDGSHGTMTFNGAIATRDGGAMSMFKTRIYNYDSNLLYRQPPWWPGVGDAYTVLYEREVSPSQ
jgi:hypothetical protein